jgi:hypothetical protein
MRRTRLVLIALTLLVTASSCAQTTPTAAPMAPPSPTEMPTGLPLPTPLPAGVELTAGELRVRGRQVYSRRCAICHDEEFAGSLSNALSRFSNASALFGYMRDAMPQDAPGSLELDEYLAVLAKVLVENGIVSEDSTLDPNSLAEIAFQ